MLRRRLHQIVRRVALSFASSWWQKLSEWKAERIERPFWRPRIDLVLSCPDNFRLPRHPNAGRVTNGNITMHNGLKVLANSYYKGFGRELLALNNGCHEPQEEVIFDFVLKTLSPGSIMLELGAYWGFYSLWFKSIVKNSQVFLVEPDLENLEIGKNNFNLNGLDGNFTQGWVGNHPPTESLQLSQTLITVDQFLAEKRIAHLAILHADIQGYELDMLKGAENSLASNAIDWLFISTHTNELSLACSELLHSHNYKILDSVNLDESYSYDGILVAHRQHLTIPSYVSVSKRSSKG